MALSRATRVVLTAVLAIVFAAVGYVELVCATAIGAPGIFLLVVTAWLTGFLICGLAKFNVYLLAAALVLSFTISGLAVLGANAGDAVKLLGAAGAAYACAIAGWIIGRNVAARRAKDD
jgi:hypothetical protein